MIISFAWTIDAFLDGSKTVTRRFWTDDYAAKFHEGDVHQGYNKSPRAGGHYMADVLITAEPYKEPLSKMTDAHFEREGGTRYWKDKAEFIEMMGGPDKTPWVIEFKKVDNE